MRRMPPPWEEEGLTREQYGRKHLGIAFNVEFDSDDKDYQGDIRYDDLQRNNNNALISNKWRSQEPPSEPPHIRRLVNGEPYMLAQLPLGSVFKMQDGNEHVLDNYTYMPRPRHGSSIKISNQISDLDKSYIINEGLLTDLGRTEVEFLSHPNKIHFAKPSKSAAMGKSPAKVPRRVNRLPKVLLELGLGHLHQKLRLRLLHQIHFIKQKKKQREKRVLSRKRTRRRKRSSRARARTESPLKLKSESKSPTRRRAKSK